MKLLVLCFLVLASQALMGQNKQLLYNSLSLPQSLLLNPAADVDFDTHIGVPFLSQLHLSAGSSGVDLHDVFGAREGLPEEQLRAVVREMKNKDFFSFNQQAQVLSFGWRFKHEYYVSAGIYQETDVFAYFPRDVAVLLLQGNTGEGNRNFGFSSIAATGEVINVFHLGLGLDYNDNLRVGVRGKIYSSILNARSLNNSGKFFSHAPGNPNTAQPAISNLDLEVKTSGLSLLNFQDIRQAITGFTNEAFLGGNLGLGLDLGFSYYFNDRYRISGSLTDVGIIRHSKGVENYGFKGDFALPQLQQPLLGGETSEDEPNPYDDFEDNFEEEISSESYYSTRPVNLYASLDYGFGEIFEACNCLAGGGRRKYRHHLGLQVHSVKRPKGMVSAISATFSTRLSQYFVTKLAYTADSFSFSNLGLLFSAQVKAFNFYIAADNLLDYVNLAKARNASLQLGFQFVLRRK